ncbi:MAG: hypothetical protein WCL51_18035 [Bacteroidota bacterium]
MTKSTSHEFIVWLIQLLIENKPTIEDANPTVTFDVDGLISYLKALDLAYITEVGKITALEQAKIKQVKKANEKLVIGYKAASSAADSISGHLGNDDALSKLIHQKRKNMVNIALRGKRNPPTDETSTDTPSTDITPTT